MPSRYLFGNGGGGGGGNFNLYDSYDLLPSGAGTGEVAGVQNPLTPELTEAYAFLDKIGAISVGIWVPYRYYDRITSLVSDASANPCYINCAIGDDLAAVLARGWTNDSTGTATVADATDGTTDVIQFTGDTGDLSALSFTPAAYNNELLALVQLRVVGVESTDGFFNTALFVIDGTRAMWTSFGNLVPNSIQQASAFTTAAGFGTITKGDNYNMTFVSYARGVDNTLVNAWSPFTADETSAFYTQFGGLATVGVSLSTQGSINAQFNLEKFYLINLD